MNSKHRKTLQAVFARPVNGGLHFGKIESLLLAVGCERVEAKGSAVLFCKNGHVVQFHRPHPQREALRYVGPVAVSYGAAPEAIFLQDKAQ